MKEKPSNYRSFKAVSHNRDNHLRNGRVPHNYNRTFRPEYIAIKNMIAQKNFRDFYQK